MSYMKKTQNKYANGIVDIKCYYSSIFILLCMIGCGKEHSITSTTSFTIVNPEHSGIKFKNSVVENDTLNYFKFPYMYMGGGVSTGDINNDGLPDIYLTGNMVSNKLYLNKGNMQFEDITDEAGVAGDDRWYSGTTMVDINNDGWLDIYVCVSGKFSSTRNQLFINNGNNTFTERAAGFGLDDNSSSIQSTFFDYNNDGLLDVFVANYPMVPVSQGNRFYYEKMNKNVYSQSAHLYKNDGNGAFTDVTREAGVDKFGLSLGIIASDFNNDGWQDLYVSNDFNVPDYFYLNNKDGSFKEVIKKVTSNTSMFGMGIDVSDFNNDGLVDILQVDMTPENHKRSKTNMASMSPESFYEAVELGFHYQYMQNSLQLNNGVNLQGLPIFSNISRISGIATTDWSWSSLFADFDNDGWKDIIITNGMKRDVNNNDANLKMTSQNFFGKIEDQGFLLYPSNPIDNYVYKNNGDFTFTKMNDSWNISQQGFSNGASYCDLDNDGDLDIILNNLDNTASVFKNNTKSRDQNYLKIKLKGPKNNTFGLGSKVFIKSEGILQSQELTLSRGFQSSVSPTLHFGLGSHKLVDEIQIVWPNGKMYFQENIEANQTLKISFEEAKQANKKPNITKEAPFKDITAEANINFVHREDVYNDFSIEPLLPHKNSQYGPALTVGDVNGDGLDDFFVGNAAGSSAAMYIQKDTGRFEILRGPWELDSIYEDTGALLVDIDNDTDLDLYVVNGGNDPSRGKQYYQDRIYINMDHTFVKGNDILPLMTTSGSKIIAADYDKDGDQDLFVGGRLIPGQYPFPAKSFILRNDGGNDLDTRFIDVSSIVLPELKSAGLITSAIWDDFDNDGWVDLIIAGEWTPIRFFRNNEGTFIEVTETLGLDKHTGWWNGLTKIDIDFDGDMDYLIGNLGLNYKYHADKESPFEIYANDFDENGKNDIVLGYKKDNIKIPLRGRQCSSEQVAAIKKRFTSYESFASASLSDIYGQSMLDNSLHYMANTFSNYWIENKEGTSFVMHPLPNYAQFSSINDFEILESAESKNPRLILGGNLYNSEVETPRNDASLGLILTYDVSNQTMYETKAHESNLFIHGDIRNIERIGLGKKQEKGILFAINNDSLRLIKYRSYD